MSGSLANRLSDAAGGNPHLAANVVTLLAGTVFENHPVRDRLLDLAAEVRVEHGPDLSPFAYLRGIVAAVVRDAAWKQTQDGDLASRIAADAAGTLLAGLSPKLTNEALDLCVGFLRENPTWLAGVVEGGEQQ